MYTRDFKCDAKDEIQGYFEDTVGQDQSEVVKKFAIRSIMKDIDKIVRESLTDKRWELALGVSVVLYPSGTLEVFTQEEGEGSL